MNRKITCAVCILYIIGPIDLIPDLKPVFGWLDDMGVLAFMVHTNLSYRNEIEALAGQTKVVEPLVLESSAIDRTVWQNIHFFHSFALRRYLLPLLAIRPT